MKTYCRKRPRNVLNPNAQKILAFLLARPGYPPSYPEIRAAVGINFRAIQWHLAGLRARGLVAWQAHQPRTLHATCRYIPVGELATSSA